MGFRCKGAEYNRLNELRRQPYFSSRQAMPSRDDYRSVVSASQRRRIMNKSQPPTKFGVVPTATAMQTDGLTFPRNMDHTTLPGASVR